MLAAKDSKPATSGERETTASENEKSSTTSTPQPSGLGELAAPPLHPQEGGRERYSEFKSVPLLELTSLK